MDLETSVLVFMEAAERLDVEWLEQILVDLDVEEKGNSSISPHAITSPRQESGPSH